MVLQLKSCCCGCSLKTGSSIIGWLCMIGSIFAIIFGIAIAILGAGALQKVKEQQQDSSTVYDKNQTTENLTLSLYVLLGTAAFILIVGPIQAIVSGMLLHGINTDRPHLMKPWIVYAIIEIVIQCVATLVYVGASFVGGQIGIALLQLLISPCSISIAVYYVLVVNSYRRELILSSMSSKI